MDINLNDEQLAFRDSVRRLAEKEFKPYEALWETDRTYARKALKALGDHKLLGLNIAAKYGGSELSSLDSAICIEEMGKVSPDAALYMAAASLGQAYYIQEFGSEDHCSRYLPHICAGDYTSAIGITEPGAGTASTAMVTRAERHDGHYVINGHKHYVSNVGLAGLFIIYARLKPGQGAGGIGAFLIERDHPGFVIERLSENMSGGFQADLRFDDCVIPESSLLAGEGAFGKLTSCYNLERCGGSAGMLGIAAGAFEQALAYVQEREQFGRNLVEFQAVQLKLADMAIRLEAARLMLLRALTSNPEGFPMPLETSMAKVMTLESGQMVTDTAIQLFGGAGYLKETGIERRYRVVRGFAIAGGPLDIHKTMIAGWLSGKRFSQWAPGAATQHAQKAA